jgi:hypothetical protein
MQTSTTLNVPNMEGTPFKKIIKSFRDNAEDYRKITSIDLIKSLKSKSSPQSLNFYKISDEPVFHKYHFY